MNVWLYVAVVMVMMAIPLIVAYVRDVSDHTYYIISALALLSVYPPIWFLWFGAMGLAIFGRKTKAARHKFLLVVTTAFLLLTLVASSAEAQMYSRTENYTQKNTSGLVMFKMSLRADWDGNRSTDTISNLVWTKSYGNGIYRLDHWVSTTDTSGRYSYGTRWKQRKVVAEFKACAIQFGVNVCTYQTGYVWMRIDSDGNYSASHGLV